ncbi:MAG: hypothetical protein LPK03_07540, partial [Pontibacter sp.]|nr:hypothetical protein [Pontibacter sp.]
MFTLFMVLKRWLCSLALYLLVVPVLFAQRPVQDFGNQTLPNRVVYKLKQPQAALLRSTGGNSMANALQQIGARQVSQKFPEMAAQQTSAMARKAAPAVDLSLIYELEYASGHT